MDSSLLSQDEVDALLKGISGGEFEVHDGSARQSMKRFPRWGLKKLSKFLTDPFGAKQREYDAMWMFKGKIPHNFKENRDVRKVRFFEDKKGGESMLAEIYRLNEAQGHGNIKIPGTEIELINYSYCPQCQTPFSYQAVQDYYANPNPVQGLDRNAQYRGDTRMHCGPCDTYFHHTLVISDGTPRNESWFLCRSQTVGAIERFYGEMDEKVLTRNGRNRITGEGDRMGILNDVDIDTLSREPGLVSALLQYTPPKFILSFVEGQNLENKDLLFGQWL